MAVRVGFAAAPALPIAPAWTASSGPAIIPPRGRPSLDVADDRLLVVDLLGAGPAGRGAAAARPVGGPGPRGPPPPPRRFQPAARPGDSCELPQQLLSHLAGIR